MFDARRFTALVSDVDNNEIIDEGIEDVDEEITEEDREIISAGERVLARELREKQAKLAVSTRQDSHDSHTGICLGMGWKLDIMTFIHGLLVFFCFFGSGHSGRADSFDEDAGFPRDKTDAYDPSPNAFKSTLQNACMTVYQLLFFLCKRCFVLVSQHVCIHLLVCL